MIATRVFFLCRGSRIPAAPQLCRATIYKWSGGSWQIPKLTKIARRGWQVIIAVCGLLLLVGCSGYSAIEIATEDAPRNCELVSEQLYIGQDVRITMLDNETVAGSIESIGECELHIGRHSNYGFETREIRFDSIKRIEIPSATRGTTAILYVLIGVAAVAVAVGLGSGLGGMSGLN